MLHLGKSITMFVARPWAAAILSLGLLSGLGVKAETYTEIANTSTEAGDGSTLFAFDAPQISNTELTNNHVVFAAASLKGLTGLYVVPIKGGKPVKVADTHTDVPDGTGTFTGDFYSYTSAFHPNPSACSGPVLASASTVVFIGQDADHNRGIYAVPVAGGKVKKLVDYKSAIPHGPVAGQTHFSHDYDFCNISASGDTVVFDGGLTGVYSVNTGGTDLTRIDDPSDVRASPIEHLPYANTYYYPWISGSKVGYLGGNVYGPELVIGGGTTGPGAALSKTPGPNEPQGFAWPNIYGTTVMYAAEAENKDALFYSVSTEGGAHTLLFDQSTTKVPPGTRGNKFDEVTIFYSTFASTGRRYIFTASTIDPSNNTYYGVFSVCRPTLSKPGTLSKLVQTGDTIGKSLAVRTVDTVSQVVSTEVDDVEVDQFATHLTYGPPTDPPTIYDGANAIYVVTVPHC
jgi:hypothetical protein